MYQIDPVCQIKMAKRDHFLRIVGRRSRAEGSESRPQGGGGLGLLSSGGGDVHLRAVGSRLLGHRRWTVSGAMLAVLLGAKRNRRAETQVSARRSQENRKIEGHLRLDHLLQVRFR